MGVLKLDQYEDVFGQEPIETDFSSIGTANELKKVMENSRQKYADVIELMQRDPALSEHIAHSFKGGKRMEGQLSAVTKRLHKFYDWVFKNKKNYLNAEAITERLASSFEDTMKDVIKKWPKLAEAGADWNGLCWGFNKSFVEMARVFGVGNEMEAYISHWFDVYKRDQLNAQALEAHRTLAYYSTLGGQNEEIIEGVRGQIHKVEAKLGELPVHEENYPAFSRLNPEHDVKSATEKGTVRPFESGDAQVIQSYFDKKSQKEESPWEKEARQRRVAAMPGVKPKPKKKKPWWKFW